ncbi:hypothetical protein BCR33DRAFT_736700 [Rhizoclosmatium globosum]|uniref:Rrp15p-domain-containing protein n=1 Tax=Rhizoclosmatium globosum TaxID=329046 RepID=A0A1Y2CHP7_9FUNG|nr:hypothetical protein BCR33DRAFT_736700 [Rhizoclosmatium globosum]|eukprot:ORY46532.1 hypothetical protein BCR33DRAFT_736700 [Rhizoclosmatium globosum]
MPPAKRNKKDFKKRKAQEYESDDDEVVQEDEQEVARTDEVDEADDADEQDDDEVNNNDDEQQIDNDQDAESEDPSKKQTKLAYAMSRILGSALLEEQDDSTQNEPKPKKQKLERRHNPILSKHKSIETALDDAKLEEKAKKLISKEKKVKTIDVARIKPEELIAVNELEKRLKKVATRGVVKLFNAIRVAQKSVESVKAEGGVLKNAAKLSQGGFMQMIKESSVKPATTSAAATSKAKASVDTKTKETAAPKGGGGVPWIDDGFMMKNAGEKAWDEDSD